MKNAIPVVIAVVLGFIAVFAVSRAVSKNTDKDAVNRVNVVIANGHLKSGEVIGKESISAKSVPLAYAPKQYIPLEQAGTLIGQTLSSEIAPGDYLQWKDIGRATNTGDAVGEGEWAVPVSFSNSSLVKMLKAGDEIAIIGQFSISVEKASKSANVNAEKEYETKTVTTVLFPLVRIMGKIGNDGVLLSLPPKQAMIVIAAQSDAEGLYAALRRPNDEKSTSRTGSGMFDNSAFVEMLKGCEGITVPDQPSNKTK